MKHLRVPKAGDLTVLTVIEQDQSNEKPELLWLNLKDEHQRIRGQITRLDEIRKLWQMCQEIIKARTGEEPKVPQDREVHLQRCGKCGRWIKWFETYDVATGPDSAKKNRFKRCYVCAEGYHRNKQQLLLVTGGWSDRVQ